MKLRWLHAAWQAERVATELPGSLCYMYDTFREKLYGRTKTGARGRSISYEAGLILLARTGLHASLKAAAIEALEEGENLYSLRARAPSTRARLLSGS